MARSYSAISSLRATCRGGSRTALYFWIISNLVEKESGVPSEKILFSSGSANRDSSRMQMGPLPGQKSIRLAKKGGGSSFPDAGFRRFSAATPLPPRLFAETKKEDQVWLFPALFGFGACFLARATRKRVCATNEFGDDSYSSAHGRGTLRVPDMGREASRPYTSRYLAFVSGCASSSSRDPAKPI
jgi:hypothetical protein